MTTATTTHRPADTAKTPTPGITLPHKPTRGPSLMTRYRTWYHSLPPALQMVGMQMWMPLAIVAMFSFCYAGAFHSPTYHDAPIGLVRTDANIAAATEIGNKTGDTFDFRFYDTPADAEKALIKGNIVAVLTPPAPNAAAHLTMASANSEEGTVFTEQAFAKVFGETPIAINDLRPYPTDKDGFGLVSMYLWIPWVITAYITVTYIATMGQNLGHTTRLNILFWVAVFAAITSNVIGCFWMNSYSAHHFWPLLFWTFFVTFSTMVCLNGLSYFFGRFVALPALALCVCLSVPGSGGGYPLWMMPTFFRDIGNFTLGRSLTEANRRIIYDAGWPMWQSLLGVCAYLALGVMLMIGGKFWREQREHKRVLSGQSTMMATAMAANMKSMMAKKEQHQQAHARTQRLEAIAEQVAAQQGQDGANPPPDAAVVAAVTNASASANIAATDQPPAHHTTTTEEGPDKGVARLVWSEQERRYVVTYL